MPRAARAPRGGPADERRRAARAGGAARGRRGRAGRGRPRGHGTGGRAGRRAGPPGDRWTVEHAQAELRPDGGPPTRDAAWPLARRWDRQYPGRGGTARFEVDLDAPADRRPAALLFYRIGNQAVVRLNGQLLQQWGEPGRPEVDVAKQARWIELPADRLRPGPNRLVIELGIQAQRWGGLASFDYGPRELLAERLAANRFWRGQITQVFAIGLGLMGALAAALWWRQRDPLFGCFALGAGLGIVRHADRLIETAPLPWPLWGGVVAASYAAHLALMARFAVMTVGPRPRRLLAGLDLLLGATVLAALGAFLGAHPQAWTLALQLLVPGALAALGWVGWQAWRGERLGRMLLAIGAVAVLAGVHDLTQVRLGLGPVDSVSWTPHAMFLFVLVMAGIVVERYTGALRRERAHADELARQLEARERALRGAYDELAAQQMQRAVVEERQRLMRDIHDGVGAHLVGLVSLADRAGDGQAEIARQARLALDELHMAVDAMRPVEGDLAVVLGNLRYRLDSRLRAAGLEVVWDVEPLPPLPRLGPAAVTQLQRIVLEAITNVVRHAGARRLQLSARAAAQGGRLRITVSVADDGRGLDAAAPAGSGHGLANMHARAAAIGAVLSIGPAHPAGTLVRLDWETDAAPSG